MVDKCEWGFDCDLWWVCVGGGVICEVVWLVLIIRVGVFFNYVISGVKGYVVK